MRLEMVECHIPFSGHCDLELTSFKNNDIRSIFLTLSKVGIPNFGVWMYIGMAECRVPFTGYSELDL